MAKELNEDTTLKLSIKTLAGIAVLIFTLVGMWFTLQAEISEAKELPFNSEDYSVGHPAVSADGKKLYFVSDMPGSIGATDIFVVDILDTDSKSDA